MPRVAAVVSLWVWISICWQPLCGQTEGQPSDIEKPSNTKATYSQHSQEAMGESLISLFDSIHGNTESTKTQEDDKTKKIQDLIVTWSAGLAALFTGLLVWVGYCGVRAANRTLKAIDKQAMLQAASMTQWVSIQNWNVEVLERVGPLSNIPKSLHITYEVVNESSFPLTMRSQLNFLGKVPGAAKHILPHLFLIPKKPYTLTLNLYIADQQASQYADAELRIAVHGRFFHVGVTGQPSPLMAIDGNLVCGRTAKTRMELETVSMVPDTETAQNN